MIDIPKTAACITIINVPSYASGCNLWGNEPDSTFRPPAIGDKLLEVVAIDSSLHLASIQVNMASGTRIGQGSKIKLCLKRDLPVQVDGEPFLQPSSEITVEFWNQMKMLLNFKSK